MRRSATIRGAMRVPRLGAARDAPTEYVQQQRHQQAHGPPGHRRRRATDSADVRPVAGHAQGKYRGYDSTGYTAPKITGVSKVDTTTPAWSASNDSARRTSSTRLSPSTNAYTQTYPLSVGDTSPGPDVVNLGCDVWFREVLWAADRNISNPELPDPMTGDDNEVLLEEQLGVNAPRLPSIYRTEVRPSPGDTSTP